MLWRASGPPAEVVLTGETRIARDLAGRELARPLAGALGFELGGAPVFLVPE